MLFIIKCKPLFEICIIKLIIRILFYQKSNDTISYNYNFVQTKNIRTLENYKKITVQQYSIQQFYSV